MKIDLILIDILLSPPAVDVDRDRNVTPRVQGDKLIPLLRTKRPLSRFLLMSAMDARKEGMSAVLRSYPFLGKLFTKHSCLQERVWRRHSGAKRYVIRVGHFGTSTQFRAGSDQYKRHVSRGRTVVEH